MTHTLLAMAKYLESLDLNSVHPNYRLNYRRLWITMCNDDEVIGYFPRRSRVIVCVKKRKRTLSYFIISLVAHTTAAALRKIKKKNNIFSTFPGLLKYFKRKTIGLWPYTPPPTGVTTMVCGCYLELHLYYFIFGGKKNLGYIRNDVIATNNN